MIGVLISNCIYWLFLIAIIIYLHAKKTCIVADRRRLVPMLKHHFSI
jgi:hypothetical protein